MNFKKIIASVAAGALALTSLATVASADTVDFTFTPGTTNTYTTTITKSTAILPVDFEIGAGWIQSSVKASDSVTLTKLSADSVNGTVSEVKILGVVADSDGKVTAGVFSHNDDHTLPYTVNLLIYSCCKKLENML